MQVSIPSSLRSYTKVSRVEAVGVTVREVLADLDRQFPGIRFRMVDELGRIRPHMRIFVNGQATHDLARPLRDGDEFFIVQALSGG